MHVHADTHSPKKLCTNFQLHGGGREGAGGREREGAGKATTGTASTSGLEHK